MLDLVVAKIHDNLDCFSSSPGLARKQWISAPSHRSIGHRANYASDERRGYNTKASKEIDGNIGNSFIPCLPDSIGW